MGRFEEGATIPGSNTIKIRHQGGYDFQKVTDSILGWLKRRGYFIQYKDQTEAIKPEGKETIYEWNCDRQPVPYIKFYIYVLVYTYHMTDVIVEKNGRQLKLQTGDLQIQIKGEWKKNFNEAFPPTKFGEFLRRMYERYVAFDRLKGYWGKIYGEILEVAEVAKKALDLYTR